MVNREFAISLLGGVEKFEEFMVKVSEDICLEINCQNRLTDEKAIGIIKKKGKVRTAQSIQQLDKEERDKILRVLKEEGVSIRQISRLTGINRGG